MKRSDAAGFGDSHFVVSGGFFLRRSLDDLEGCSGECQSHERCIEEGRWGVGCRSHLGVKKRHDVSRSSTRQGHHHCETILLFHNSDAHRFLLKFEWWPQRTSRMGCKGGDCLRAKHCHSSARYQTSEPHSFQSTQATTNCTCYCDKV